MRREAGKQFREAGRLRTEVEEEAGVYGAVRMDTEDVVAVGREVRRLHESVGEVVPHVVPESVPPEPRTSSAAAFWGVPIEYHPRHVEEEEEWNQSYKQEKENQRNTEVKGNSH